MSLALGLWHEHILHTWSLTDTTFLQRNTQRTQVGRDTEQLQITLVISLCLFVVVFVVILCLYVVIVYLILRAFVVMVILWCFVAILLLFL